MSQSFMRDMSSHPLHTKNRTSLTPKLRFNGFSAGWSLQTLSEVVNVIDCKHRTPEYVEEGVPVVSPGTIKWGEIDLISPTKRVTYEDYKSLMDHCSPKKGDMVFSRNQSVGIASLVVNETEFVLGQDTVLMQSIGIDSGFSYYTLQGRYVQGQISRLSGGSTFSRINLGEIRKLKLRITPNEDEQQRIASFLSAVDEKIQQLARKKELLEQYKKGVMQPIFSGKLRFHDEDGKAFQKWEKLKLGDLILDIADGGTPPSNNPDYFNGEINWVVIDDVKDEIHNSKNKLTSEGLRKCSSKLWNPETIILTTGATIGKVGIAKVHTATKQGICGIVVNGNVSNLFMKYWFSHNTVLLNKFAQGSSFKELRPPTLIKLDIKLPSFKEQQKIAGFLSAIDSMIESVSNQIEQTQTFKKGLLQQMFV
jgi:type I restriction enzyme, S subunit